MSPSPASRTSGLTPVLAITTRELQGLFLSPLAWTVLGVVQLVVGIVFVVQLQVFLDPPRVAALSQTWGLTRVVAAPVLNWAAFLLMLSVPVLAMRVVSEERRQGTIALLFSSPVSVAGIIAGKYLALMGFVVVQVALVASLPAALLLGGSLDLGLFATEVLGLLLLGWAFCAAGLMMSSMTAQPALAAVGTFSALLILWILSWRGPGAESSALAGWFHYLSWQLHFDPFLKGVIDTRDVAYFLVFSLACLILGVRRLECAR